MTVSAAAIACVPFVTPLRRAALYARPFCGDALNPELARLVIGYICLHSTLTGVRMAAPLLGLSLGYDKAQVGMLVALAALPQLLIALPAGRWADRTGIKAPVRAGVALATLAGAVPAIWRAYPALCFSTLCAGAAIATAVIALQRHVGRAAQSREQLKQAFSWLSIAPALSNLFGPVATGFAIDHGGYRVAFLFLAALPVTGWLWMRTARELPQERGGGAAKSESAWTLWREPGFRRLLLMNWFMSASWDVHGFLVPVIGHDRGLPAAAIGTILGSFAIGAALVRITLPLVAARMTEWKLITGAMVITALVFGAYPLAASAALMAFCSAMIGLALGSVQPLVMSLLHQITPPHRHGEAVGMRLLTVNVSSVTMPLVFGAAGGIVGAASLFWVMSLVLGAGTRVAFSLRGIRDTQQH